MRPSRVLQRWAEGKPALATTVHLTDPSVAELVSLLGFDCVWIDMEHHVTSVEAGNQMMRGARVGGADVLARPAKGEFMRMGRMLEAGAQGILYPRCDSADEARQVVRWAKFHPLGERGFDGGNPDMPYCTMDTAAYVRYANEQTWIGVQIESPAVLPHVRAIAEVEGVDLIFMGPGDFSVLSGIPGKFDDPVILRATERICRDALAAGKRFGMPCSSTQHARQLLDMGATFLAHGADIVLIKRALEQIRAQFGELGFAFGAAVDGASQYAGVAR